MLGQLDGDVGDSAKREQIPETMGKQPYVRHGGGGGIAVVLQVQLGSCLWVCDKDIDRHPRQGTGGCRRKAESRGHVELKVLGDGQ